MMPPHPSLLPNQLCLVLEVIDIEDDLGVKDLLQRPPLRFWNICLVLPKMRPWLDLLQHMSPFEHLQRKGPSS